MLSLFHVWNFCLKTCVFCGDIGGQRPIVCVYESREFCTQNGKKSDLFFEKIALKKFLDLKKTWFQKQKGCSEPRLYDDALFFWIGVTNFYFEDITKLSKISSKFYKKFKKSCFWILTVCLDNIFPIFIEYCSDVHWTFLCINYQRSPCKTYFDIVKIQKQRLQEKVYVLRIIFFIWNKR